MYKDEINSSSLAELLSPFNYLIVDTCSLMDPNFPEWMDVLANAKEYRDPNQPIFVFYKIRTYFIYDTVNVRFSLHLFVRGHILPFWKLYCKAYCIHQVLYCHLRCVICRRT